MTSVPPSGNDNCLGLMNPQVQLLPDPVTVNHTTGLSARIPGTSGKARSQHRDHERSANITTPLEASTRSELPLLLVSLSVPLEALAGAPRPSREQASQRSQQAICIIFFAS